MQVGQLGAVAAVVEHAVEFWVHVRDVVALEVVVDVDLPVAGDVVADALVVAVGCEPAVADDAFGDARHQRVEIRGVSARGEHQALPHLHLQLRQAHRGEVEAFRRRHLRRRLQLAVEAVGPAVVAAAQGLGAASVAGRDWPGAVAADVVQHADRAVEVAHGEHRQAGEIGHHMVAGFGELANVRDQVPAAVEDRAAVQGDDARIGVAARRQRRGLRQRLRRQFVGGRWRAGHGGSIAPRHWTAEGRRAPAFAVQPWSRTQPCVGVEAAGLGSAGFAAGLAASAGAPAAGFAVPLAAGG